MIKLGIIGLPQSGKLTIFRALTGTRAITDQERVKKSDQLIGTVNVPDERVDHLSKIFKPKKTIYSQVEYLLPTTIVDSDHFKGEKENLVLNTVRICDGLLHVLKNFQLFGESPPTPEKDFLKLEADMILSDLMVVEKRIEKINSDEKKGKEVSSDELALLKKCRGILSDNKPLRDNAEITTTPLLKGFTFLSAKPMLVIFNNSDEHEEPPKMSCLSENIEAIVVRGKLEMEIAEMEPEEAKEFLSAFHVEKSLIERVIQSSLSASNLISFFTVEGNEVRSWTITKGASALEAADHIHSDMKMGFIRAEVLPHKDFVRYGGVSEARKDGHLRLEGKEYIIQDGDIIKFRFNV